MVLVLLLPLLTASLRASAASLLQDVVIGFNKKIFISTAAQYPVKVSIKLKSSSLEQGFTETLPFTRRWRTRYSFK